MAVLAVFDFAVLLTSPGQTQRRPSRRPAVAGLRVNKAFGQKNLKEFV